MRSRFATVVVTGCLAVCAWIGDGNAQVAPARQFNPMDGQPIAVPLLHRILDTVGARPVRVAGTVESATKENGTITLKLVNRIPGSDSAAIYLIGSGDDVAGLARFGAEDNVRVAGVLERRAIAAGAAPTYYLIPHSAGDVTPIGWTRVRRERLTVGVIAVVALVLLIAVPLRGREPDDPSLEPMHLKPEYASRMNGTSARASLRTTARVLLIEDEALVRLAARRGLERNGFEVEEAASGTDAMALWREEGDTFDCVVSDIMLPGELGPEVVERMRSDRTEIPVLYVSGSAKRLSPGALDVPHTAFLQKPFGSKQLSDALSALLNPAPFAA